MWDNVDCFKGLADLFLYFLQRLVIVGLRVLSLIKVCDQLFFRFSGHMLGKHIQTNPDSD